MGKLVNHSPDSAPYLQRKREFCQSPHLQAKDLIEFIPATILKRHVLFDRFELTAYSSGEVTTVTGLIFTRINGQDRLLIGHDMAMSIRIFLR